MNKSNSGSVPSRPQKSNGKSQSNSNITSPPVVSTKQNSFSCLYDEDDDDGEEPILEGDEDEIDSDADDVDAILEYCAEYAAQGSPSGSVTDDSVENAKVFYVPVSRDMSEALAALVKERKPRNIWHNWADDDYWGSDSEDSALEQATTVSV